MMKTFKYVLMAGCLLGVLYPGISNLLGQEKISGKYVIHSKDVILQTDKYEIMPGTSFTDEIQGAAPGDSAQRFEMTLENSKFRLLEKKVNNVVESSIKVGNNIFSFYEKTAMVGALPDENNTPVFESAAFSNYTLILGLYDQAKGGKQTFSVVIPALQDFINIEIERHGTDAFKVGEQSLVAAHYRVAIGKKRETVNCWVDNNKVIAIFLASNNVFAIDDAYPQLYEKVKQVINRAM